MAAALLGRRIRVIGPVFDEAYAVRHSDLFRADHVDMAGELGGADKTAALRAGRVLVYACARYYVEAGAAVFGESLRAGTGRCTRLEAGNMCRGCPVRRHRSRSHRVPRGVASPRLRWRGQCARVASGLPGYVLTWLRFD
jgi:hypothetical protein